MERSRPLSALIDDLVAAIEERDIGDPDAGDWLIGTRIRRLERDLVMAYRTDPDARRQGEANRRGDREGDEEAALAGVV